MNMKKNKLGPIPFELPVVEPCFTFSPSYFPYLKRRHLYFSREQSITKRKVYDIVFKAFLFIFVIRKRDI